MKIVLEPAPLKSPPDLGGNKKEVRMEKLFNRMVLPTIVAIAIVASALRIKKVAAGIIEYPDLPSSLFFIRFLFWFFVATFLFLIFHHFSLAKKIKNWRK